jgi:hypothetical protein
MQKHIQLLGILYVIYNAFGLIFAWFIWGILSTVGMLSGDPAAMGILAAVGTVIAVIFFFLSAPGVVAGIGVLKGWWWARWLTLILGFFNLIYIPLGTILGVYTFWVLLQDETIAYFEADRLASANPMEPPAPPA